MSFYDSLGHSLRVSIGIKGKQGKGRDSFLISVTFVFIQSACTFLIASIGIPHFLKEQKLRTLCQRVQVTGAGTDLEV